MSYLSKSSKVSSWDTFSRQTSPLKTLSRDFRLWLRHCSEADIYFCSATWGRGGVGGLAGQKCLLWRGEDSRVPNVSGLAPCPETPVRAPPCCQPWHLRDTLLSQECLCFFSLGGKCVNVDHHTDKRIVTYDLHHNVCSDSVEFK